MAIDKKKIWKTAFYACVVLYVINLLCIIATGNCIFLNTSGAYNYLSAVLNAVFLIIFFNFLKKGSLTVRYLMIMFGLLVVFPFIISLISGGIAFL